MKEKILTTGGSGFIGTNLVEFYKDGFVVLNLDILPPRNNYQIYYWKEYNILDLQQTSHSFEAYAPKHVFYMAASTDLDGKTMSDYEANTQGLINIRSVLRKVSSIEKIIFSSSRLFCEIGYQPKDEYDYKPTTVYGERKIIGEKIVRESDLNEIKQLIV